jgi:hypothetical protein
MRNTDLDIWIIMTLVAASALAIVSSYHLF